MELIIHVFEWRLWEVPLDVDAVTSPRYTREPLSLSLHLIEVSHISIRKSSITLRLFPIWYESASAETIKEPFALQSYKIVGNNEQKARKNNLNARG